MNPLIFIIWLLIFLKLFLFWLWLWQLKEYHIGRFLAHFEAQKIKKIISSFWRLKYPIFTKKIIVIFVTGILLAILWLSSTFSPIILIVFAPVFCSLLILLFQIPTVFWRKLIINKARKKRAQFKNLLVIGITGSYGKTSTKEFLSTILSTKFRVLKTKENQNSEVGISKCILNELNKEHEVFVCEMGAYNKGGIKFLCDIVKPKIGIVTGVNEQHLATFGKMENLLSAEGGGELIESLSEDGLAILNYDNPIIRERKIEHYNPKLKNIKFYSMSGKETDLWASDIKIEKESISFRLSSKEGDQATFNLNLLGAHNIYNVLAAACCAKSLGMTLEEIAKTCGKIERWQSGMQLKPGIDGLNIIDATYSANPTGVISHLDYLKVWPGKKVIIMPCLIELGEASENVHRRIGKKIGEVCDLAIITTKDRFKEITEGAGDKAIFLENSKEIFEKIKDFCREGDVILLESRMPDHFIEQLTP